MTAFAILNQSFHFYSRLFNKVFWLSVASSLSPLLMFFVVGAGQPSILGMLLVMLLSMFFSAYIMVLIHQYSQDQDDSLSSAFSLTLKKVLPITGTSIVFGLFAVVVAIPAGVIASLLASGIEDKQLQAGFIALIVSVPVCYVLYRCFFAVYFTLVDGTSPIEALKASNQLVKGNGLVFRSFMLLSVVMLAYVAIIVLISQMIAVGSMAQAILEFAVNVIVLPYFTISIYRIFDVARQQKLSLDESDDESGKDD